MLNKSERSPIRFVSFGFLICLLWGLTLGGRWTAVLRADDPELTEVTDSSRAKKTHPKPSPSPTATKPEVGAGDESDKKGASADETPSSPAAAAKVVATTTPATGFISVTGTLPPSLGTVNSLLIIIDRESGMTVPVTGGAVQWRSGPLSVGSHSVTVRKGVRETLATWEKIAVAEDQVTPLPMEAFSAPGGLLVVDLEYRGLPRFKLGSNFDVSVDGVKLAEKGKLVSSDSRATVQVNSYHFEAKVLAGHHRVAVTLCEPDGACATKQFESVRVALNKTTRVLHKWKGMAILSSHGGIRDFDAACDCDGKQWEPTGP
jgi:hypothetical protein